MGLTLRKDDLDSAFPMPPQPDLGAILGAIESVKELQRLISDHEVRIAGWRSSMRGNLVGGLHEIRNASSELPAASFAEFLLPLIDDALAEVDKDMAWYATPVDEMPDFTPVLEKTRALSSGARRFIRKQIARIEQLKMMQHEALQEMRAIMASYRQEVVDDVEFDAHVSASLERFPVVNAILAG